MIDPSKKICLVTGASSGIGKEIAIGLAKENTHVILVCRNNVKGQKALEEIKQAAGSTSVDLLIADLSSIKEVYELSKQLHQIYPKLDVVINNAGVVNYEKQYSVDHIEMTLATNHIAPFLFNNLLIDLLQKGAPSRIINISSGSHKWGKIDFSDLEFDKRKYQFLKVYAQSKLLMTLATFELARRLAGTGITVNAVHPGAVKTNLGSDNLHNIFLKLLDKAIKFFFITPQKAAAAPVYLALSAELDGVTGQYFVKKKRSQASLTARNRELAKKVWEETDKRIIIK